MSWAFFVSITCVEAQQSGYPDHPADPREGEVLQPIYCSVPDIEVLIDDKVVTLDAATHSVATTGGRHVVQIRRAGYEPYVRAVELGPGRAYPLRCVLRALPELPEAIAARLVVRVMGAKGNVRLDGAPLPRDGRVPMGRHELRVFSAEYEPWTREIRLAAGETRTLSLDLHSQRRRPTSLGAPDYTGRAVAYGIGALGLAAGIAAVTLAVVADFRFEEWEKQDANIRQLGLVSPSDDIERNDERLRSIRALDHAALGLSIGSGVALAASAIVLFTTRSSSTERTPTMLSLRKHGVRFRVQF